LTTIAPVALLPNKQSTDVTQTYFQVVEATASYKGAVTATITGSQWDVLGTTLTMKSKTQTVNVDNTVPQVTAYSTGTRVGRGQLATIKITFNEKMSAKTANRIFISIDDPNDKIKDKDRPDTVFPARMELATDGLSASYVFLAEEIVPNTAVHGNLVITFTGGADEAGNAINLSTEPNIIAGSLTLDVGTPPTPVATLSSPYDFGTQIKWSWQQNTAGSNPNGARTGTVYFVAIPKVHSTKTQNPAPKSVTFDADANATWVMDDDPASLTTPKAKVPNLQQGTIAITATTGASGVVFTSFTANRRVVDDLGDLDPLNDEILGMSIYAVFVGSTGNVSAITAVPIAGLENIIMQ
jgi:hypothetical protein